MAKFHINPSTGNPGECSATVKDCPYGSADEHYGSAEEARAAYEVMMSPQALTRRGGLKPLKRDVFVSVLTETRDVLTEGDSQDLGKNLEEGEYSAYYYDEKTDTDRYMKIRVTEAGEIEYESTRGFKSISSPSTPRTQKAVSAIRTDLNLMVAKSDPSYCKQNKIDRITLLENSDEVRRTLAKFDWSTATGASQGRAAFENLEWVIDHDLDVAERDGRVDEINALTESKRIVSSFITELSSRRS